jgi:hypothetical protein
MVFYSAEIEILMSGWNTLDLVGEIIPFCVNYPFTMFDPSARDTLQFSI